MKRSNSLLYLVALAVAAGYVALRPAASKGDDVAAADLSTVSTGRSSTDASDATAPSPYSEPNVSETGTTADALPEGVEIPRYEISRGGQLIRHTGFTLSYDADYKTPQWVAWTLTAAEAEGTEPRGKSFTPDPAVRGAQAYTTDYKGSGYDRGHMAPAADMKWSARAMTESFYLTNVCPQNRNLNRGDWKDLEDLTRDLARRFGAVSVTAGPVYTSRSPRRIGANRVAVPDAFYKVLLIKVRGNYRAYGFLFRNEAGSRPLTAYQLTVDEVERRTGIDFFPSLPDKVERTIEACKPALP